MIVNWALIKICFPMTVVFHFLTIFEIWGNIDLCIIISHFPLFSKTAGFVLFGNELALFRDKNNWHVPCT